MLKNISKLETVIEGKTYQLLCEMDSPLMHVKDAMCQFIHYIGQIEQNIKDQAAKAQEQKVEELPKEEAKQDVLVS